MGIVWGRSSLGTVLCALSRRNILTFTKRISELLNLLHKKSQEKGKIDDTQK